MLLFLLLGCRVVADGPTCLTDSMHACGTAPLGRLCYMKDQLSGLEVRFTGGTVDAYEAVVTLDGVETAFRCDLGNVTEERGFVPLCESSGFLVAAHGDEVRVTVTPDGGSPISASFAPCWEASEPNGRCCGWAFDATVELVVGG